MEKISIIVPCYNVENQIDRCVRSIVGQTIGLEHLEIILVDDASPDHTYDKLCEWEARYPEQIMVIHLQENMHQGGARNIGMTYASGNYIGFVDSDDWIEPEMYASLYQAITQYSCEVAVCRFQRETEAGVVVDMDEKEYEYNTRKVIESVEDRKSFFLSDMPGGVYTKLYRREFIEDNHLSFPEHIMYEDNYWTGIMRLCLRSYVILDQKLYHYMVNMDSTLVRSGTHHMDRLKIEMMKIEEYQRQGCFEIYHDEIEMIFLKSYWCNTLAILFTRFSVIPMDLIDLMRYTLKTWFPDYLKNPYLKDFHPVELMLLRLIEVELSEKQLLQLAAIYRNPTALRVSDSILKTFLTS